LKKCLIVDDEEQNRYLLEVILTSCGWETRAAANGAEALAKARSDPPDIVISDILMPEMDGFALCREWKTDAVLKLIPFVFYTATYTEPRDEAFALSLGAERFIVKPQEPEVIADIIKSLLGENGPVAPGSLGEEREFFREHNEALFRKLEKKVADLEAANRNLMKWEDRYRLEFENITDVIILVDKDRRVLNVSPSLEKMLGYQTQEFIGQPAAALGKIVGSAYLPQLLADMDAILKGETIPATTYEFIDRNGTVRYGEISGSPVVREGGIGGFVAVVRDTTDRKKAADALLRTNKLLDSIVENIPDMIFLKDAQELRFVRFNRAGEELLGYSRDELLGKNDYNFFSKEQADFFTEIDRRVLEGRRVVDIPEEPIRTRERGERVLHTKKVPILNADATPEYLLGISEDITERKCILEALAASEEKFRKAFNTTPDSVNINRLTDGLYVSINPGFTRITGYTEEDVIGKTSTEFNIWVHSDDRQRLVDGLLKDGEVANLEATFRMKNGELRYGLMSASIIDLNGVPHILNITRDITERRRMEEELRASEERFRALSENAPDVIFTMNLDGVITYVNPSWTRLLGYEADAVQGRFFIDFGKEQDQKIYRKLFKSIRDGGKTVNNHIGIMLAKDGSERVFNMNFAFNRDSQGTIFGVVGTMKDVTEFMEMEKKLIHAQKMEAIGTMAGGIAHDFNNVLMGIQGYVSLILMHISPADPNYERLKMVEEQVRSGAGLSKQLLGFARGGIYEMKPTNINDIIDKTASIFSRTRKEIIIDLELAPDIWTVEVDRVQMEQVFMNLYVNSWQAMPRGGEIFLKTENRYFDDVQGLPAVMTTGKYVRIEIVDSGPGMDERTRERIFDPFFTTKDIGRGTGLGLTIVYGIIKAHKGVIEVASVPGQGTTFTIFLPASEKKVVGETAPKEAIAGGRETILLVDDEKIILDVSRELLESLGYRVYSAGGGKEAISLYREKSNEIDVVILDMIMPGLSGGETFDLLYGTNPDVKVLLASGYSLSGEAEQILARGCTGFLQKPFQIEKLSRKLREILDSVA